jgi:hypothetical protein
LPALNDADGPALCLLTAWYSFTRRDAPSTAPDGSPRATKYPAGMCPPDVPASISVKKPPAAGH